MPKMQLQTAAIRTTSKICFKNTGFNVLLPVIWIWNLVSFYVTLCC